MKLQVVLMPHADHRVTVGLGAALLPALLLAVSPAAAQTARSQLSVGARVLPACQIESDGAGAATSLCTQGADGRVSVERRAAAPAADRPSGARTAEPASPASPPTWITITY